MMRVSRGLTRGCTEVFNRKLGSSAEDASLSERAEKILYFFPGTTALTAKVRLVEIVESFVELNQLLDLGETDPIHTITLENIKYGVLEFAPSTFIVLCVNLANKSRLEDGSVLSTHSSMVEESSSFMSGLFKLVPWAGGSQGNGSVYSGVPSSEAMRNVLRRTAQSLLTLRGDAFARLSQVPVAMSSAIGGRDKRRGQREEENVDDMLKRGFRVVESSTDRSSGTEVTEMRTFLSRQVPFLLETVNFDTLGSSSLNMLSHTGLMEHAIPPRELLLECQTTFFESFKRVFSAFRSGCVLVDRLILLRGTTLVFSSLTVADTAHVLSLLKQARSPTPSTAVPQQDSYGFAPLTMLLELDGLEHLKSSKGSRTFTPVMYFPVEEDMIGPQGGSNKKFAKARVAVLKGKHAMSMVVFFREDEETARDDSYEDSINDALALCRDKFQANLNKLGESLKASTMPPQAKSSLLTKSFLYLNETNKLVNTDAPGFAQESLGRSSSASHSISKDSLAALDTAREFVAAPLDSSLCVCVEGARTVTALRSGTRLLVRFSEPGASLSYASQDVFNVIPQEVTQMNELVAKRFSSFVMM